jgi:hypothetical protein
MKESKNFLGIYAIVIIVLLVLIMFVLPDSFFSKQYEEATKQFIDANNQAKEEKAKLEAEKKKEFVDYEEQKQHILTGNYTYEIILLDSMGTTTYTYKCSGTKTGTTESGSCTSPEVFSYKEQNKIEQFKKNIDPKYIEPKNIFDLIKDVEPSIESHNLYREFTYKTKIKDLDTKVLIQTKKDDISKIMIENTYMGYIINFDNVKVDKK